jgi:thymidylate synthase (FAD)
MIEVENKTTSLEDFRSQRGKLIEYSARTCYNSTEMMKEGSHIPLIKHCVNSGHTSVLEHEKISMRVFNIEDLINYTTADLFGHFSFTKYLWTDNSMVMTGNVRAWLDLTKSWLGNRNSLITIFNNACHILYPYIFEKRDDGIIIDESNIKNFLIDDDEIFKGGYADAKKHVWKSFEIICSRSCQNQLVRHRTLSFSVQSQRYCNYSLDKFGYQVSFMKSNNEEIKKANLEAEKSYFKLLETEKPEDARQVLNNSTATKMIVSGNIESWEKFLKLRCDPHAQLEIREIANSIKKEIEAEPRIQIFTQN